jgi:hypothetical protein
MMLSLPHLHRQPSGEVRLLCGVPRQMARL